MDILSRATRKPAQPIGMMGVAARPAAVTGALPRRMPVQALQPSPVAGP